MGAACILAWAAGAIAAPTVAVDVGHGLADSGATSARGRSEFEFNRDLALVLKPVLAARGLAVRPINFAGDIESLAARPEAAQGADFLLSLHHDSVPPAELTPWTWEGRELDYSDLHRGYVLFVSRRNPALELSLACASAIGARLRRLGFVPATHHGDTAIGTHRPWADEQNGVRFYDTLLVISHSAMASALLEAGMLKHREEELALRDPQRQGLMADAIATGLAACLAVPSMKAVGGD
ncbi:MAG TPA: N-acetylmuramoyl-L-alanine amidase [Azospira sp.]|nr:N-acetylmuramoyl-L-alanine amidase [Azospira sp.]